MSKLVLQEKSGDHQSHSDSFSETVENYINYKIYLQIWFIHGVASLSFAEFNIWIIVDLGHIGTSGTDQQIHPTLQRPHWFLVSSSRLHMTLDFIVIHSELPEVQSVGHVSFFQPHRSSLRTWEVDAHTTHQGTMKRTPLVCMKQLYRIHASYLMSA